MQVVRADGSQAAYIGQALSRAFDGEPNFTYIIPDDTRRARALTWFFGIFVMRLGLRYGEVYTTDDAAGAAIWMKPDTDVTFGGAVRAGLLAMPFHLGWSGFRRSIKLSGSIEKMRKQTAPKRHWYLMALGVEPARQRQGLGGALLASVLSRADSSDTACYLETFSERNVSYYRRHGFELSSVGQVSAHGPSFWGMVRTPT